MRILIDARVIQDHFPGIGRYVYNLILALAPQLEGELLALVSEHAANTRYDLGQLQQRANVQLIPTDIPIFGLRSQTRLPRLIHDLCPDLVHFPYNVYPYRVGLPTVLTLYDVIPRRFPHYFPRLTRWKIEVVQRMALRHADAYLAISHATARDFVALYGIASERITIAPLAPDPLFHPRSEEVLSAFRWRLDLPRRYLLYLGSNKPHKNLPRLVQAWRDALNRGLDRDAMLVIAGHWDDRYPQTKSLVSVYGLQRRVRFLGPISSDELPLLYAAAHAFIFPSLYEGFGLPVLEAMASGIPTGCSRAPGLTEVAGEAALTFDPAHIEEITTTIVRLMTDERFRTTLRQRGLARAASFRWEDTARITLDSYRKICHTY